MRTATIMSLLLLSVACSNTVNSQDIMTGDQLEMKAIISFALDIPSETLALLTPEQITQIYTAFAKEVGDLPPGSFNDWFHQDSSATTELSAEVRNQLRAMVAKELQVREEMLKDEEGGGGD